MDDIVGKITDITSALKIPVEAFIATSKDIYRKPNTRMWLEMEWKSNVPVDRSTSFFVGDAAGRPASGTKKKVIEEL